MKLRSLGLTGAPAPRCDPRVEEAAFEFLEHGGVGVRLWHGQVRGANAAPASMKRGAPNEGHTVRPVGSRPHFHAAATVAALQAIDTAAA